MVLTAYFVLSPVTGYRMHTSLLQRLAETDSLVGVGFAEGGLMSLEVGLGRFGDRRLEKGASLHAALVRQPWFVHSRLAGNRAQEVRFTRFLRNERVGVAEMASHAASRTAAHVPVARSSWFRIAAN